MSRPRFSIVTSVNVWNEERKTYFERAVESVKNQTFRDFEWIVVNDGSPMEFTMPVLPWLQVITQPHGERIIALNTGFHRAKGEWFCLLDSDDEYTPDYLEKIDKMIRENPSYKMFNFGAVMKYKDGNQANRAPFMPKMLKVGHEVFGGGNIVNGTFVFHRSVYKKLGAFPPSVIRGIDCTEINYPAYRGQEKPYIRELWMNTPFDFSAYAQLEFPELRQFYMVDHEAEPEKILKELGNPWGNDMYLFYKYTRKYHSFPVEEYLYVVYLR